MHKRIRFARGTQSQKDASTTIIPAGMPVYTTDTNFLYIGKTGLENLRDLEPINSKGSTKLVAQNGVSDLNTTDKKLIYFNNGIPVESSQTIGSNNKFIYLNSGMFVESNINLGNTNNKNYPIKLVNGEFQENKATLDNDISGNAATADEATNSTYINDQKIELKGSNYSSYYHSITPLGNAFDSNMVTSELIWTYSDDSNFYFDTEYHIKSGSLNAGDIIYIDFDNHYIGSRFARLLKDGNNAYVVLHNTYGVRYETSIQSETVVYYSTFNYGVKLDVIKPSTSSVMFDSIKFTLTGCFVYNSLENKYKDWGINHDDFKVRAIYRIRGLSGINLS